MTQLTKRRFLRLAGVGAVAGLAGCTAGAGMAPTAGGDEGDPTDAPSESTPTPSPMPAATPSPTPDPDVAVVRMVTDNRGSYFDPKGLLLEPGTTVRFENVQGVHGTTAYHPDAGDVPLRIPESAEPWDSELFTELGATFDVTLEVPGVYDYYCRPHEMLGMVGRFVVGEALDGPGTAPLEDIPPAARERMPAVEEILARGTVAGP